MELKKLKLSENKCSKLHIGKKTTSCPKHLVHGSEMKTSEKEKYLGDIINSKASSKDTIDDRKTRGHAILSKMTAILSDIPLGKRRTEAGIELRHAWFLNGCLFNSEVWSGFTEQDLHDLEVIDHQILRLITGSHQKAPVEMLYLETAELLIKSVIIVRRLLYLQTILKRHKKELTSKVYFAMKEEPLKGDWIMKVKEDFLSLGTTFEQEEETLTKISKEELKRYLKEKIRSYTLEHLESMKLGHEKVRKIKHTDLNQPQAYIVSNKLSNKEKSLLFNLRSMCDNNFRDNFHNRYQTYQCQFCTSTDSQEHALSCNETTKYLDMEDTKILQTIKYNDLFGTVEEQLPIVKIFAKLIKIRQKLRKQLSDTTQGQAGH